MSRRRPERPAVGDPEQQGAVRPEYRRAFGCVTWLNMAILAFLAAATLLAWPLRYIGGGTGFGEVLSWLAFFGLVLILPGMVLGATLGVRSYRVERRQGTWTGAGIGAIVGWTSFFALAWIAVAFEFAQRDEAFRTVFFSGMEGSFAFYAFVPLVLPATGLILYALFARGQGFERRWLVLAGAVLVALAGLAIVIADLDLLGIIGALIATLSAAFGGWIGGLGYARAGGEAMIPPGVASKEPRGPR